MRTLLLFILFFSICLFSFIRNKTENPISVVAKGQMPNVAVDKAGGFHLVYGMGDSILYRYSNDHGNSFASAMLVAVLPKLAASHTRGPQIVSTSNGLLITACNDLGDIFSFSKNQSGKWNKVSRVNDKDTVAKENLMALAADGNLAYSVWLDLRDKHNKIFGAKSTNAGKTWTKNKLVYSSPDNTVCECCKPTVVMKGNNVYIMFRNWVEGNRDMYLIQSSDGGNTFGTAQKLGNGTWQLNGCPMDGGGLVLNKYGNLETVWNRKGAIYACEPGKQEVKIGEGRSCTLTSVNGKNVYAWVEKGNVVVLKPQGKKIVIGKGQLPLLRPVNNEHIICIWENEGQIESSILEL